MKRERDNDTDTSVSFLDVIACAFGAIALLVLILPIGDLAVDNRTSQAADYGRSLWALASLREEVSALEREVAENDELAMVLGAELTSEEDKARYLENLIARTRDEASRLRARKAAIAAGVRILEQPRPPAAAELSLDTELAGIPVDSEYIAFVVDTSGSMRQIWERVLAEITHVLSIYPRVRGFQILNDQGHYLYGGNRQQWIPDSPANRRAALDRMQSLLWLPYSASNPAPGIAAAVRDLYDKDRRMAIFVFGDDYAGDDFDGFLNRVDRAVASAEAGRGAFRIHAIGFSNEGVAGSPLNFGILMRELTRRHEGAFLALPQRNVPPRVSIHIGDGVARRDRTR